MTPGADLRLPPSRTAELRSLLMVRPEETLFHLAVIDERGVASGPGESPFAFVGWPASGPLKAAAFLGGSWFATPFSLDPRDAAALGAALREGLKLRRVVGERGATDAFWEAWSAGQARTVLSHPQQLMVARDPEGAQERLPELRPALPSEEELVYLASAAMQIEELGVDPRVEEASTFRSQVTERVRSGRTWVVVEKGEIVFKAEVALKNKLGAQIGGVWVPPFARGRRLASRGMSELTRRLLISGVPQVLLHVHERNLPAVAAYRRAGFHDELDFRLVRGLPLAAVQKVAAR